MTGKYLTPYEKGLIDTYRLNGKSISVIARLIGRSKSTICRYFKAVPAGETRISKVSPGRPRKINDYGSHVMTRAFIKSPQKSCRKLKTENPDVFGGVSVRAMQDHAARRLGFRSRTARKKTLLTEAHRRKRLEFAKKYKDWTKQQWGECVME